MKKVIIFTMLSIVIGVLFTFFVLNRENTYALEEYLVYAFQVGSFSTYDNALNYSNGLSSSIIINEDNVYKVYVGIYKDIDIINEMIVYFEDNGINIYMKSIAVSKEFYNLLDTYETIIKNRTNDDTLDYINQSILNEYLGYV